MKEKIMVVTGASSGVGKELALHFAGKDFTVYAIGRKKKNLDDVAKIRPDRIVPLSCNITDPKEVKETFDQILGDSGKIDVLINNAAVFQMRSFVDQEIEIIDSIIDTNLKGLMYVTHFALPGILKNEQAHIINIASVAGTRGIPEQAVYCASKHGVVGFGDVLAQELTERGVNVVTLCPGGIKTRLWTSGENPYPGNLDDIMDPEEIVNLVDFILQQPHHTLYKKIVLFPTNEWH